MKTETPIDLSKITNDVVRKAIEVQQNNDINAWLAIFSEHTDFVNDGVKADFKPFFYRAFDFHEKLLTIEQVNDDGNYLRGNYFDGNFGIYRVSMKFHQNESQKLDRLEWEQVGLMLNESWHQPAF